jgi:hypothetical protein
MTDDSSQSKVFNVKHLDHRILADQNGYRIFREDKPIKTMVGINASPLTNLQRAKLYVEQLQAPPPPAA